MKGTTSISVEGGATILAPWMLRLTWLNISSMRSSTPPQGNPFHHEKSAFELANAAKFSHFTIENGQKSPTRKRKQEEKHEKCMKKLVFHQATQGLDLFLTTAGYTPYRHSLKITQSLFEGLLRWSSSASLLLKLALKSSLHHYFNWYWLYMTSFFHSFYIISL